MENKNKFWKGVLVGTLLTVFAGLILVGLSVGIMMFGGNILRKQNTASKQNIEQSSASKKDSLDIVNINNKMKVIQSIIDKYYLFDEDYSKVEDGIYSGLMDGLEDPYSVYYSEKEYKDLRESTEGVYCGIGAMVSQNRETKTISIVKVFKGAPADEAGMLPGDILYAVDDQEVSGLDVDIVVGNYIRGNENSNVKITVIRNSENNKVDLNITRKQVEVPTVEYKMMSDDIGYLYVLQFDAVTANQFKNAIEDLQKQGMKKLVIDLRDNPGGLLDAAVDMMAYILPDGRLVYTADKNEKGEVYESKDGKIICTSNAGAGNMSYPKDDNHELKIPMAVLVNGNSASAAEVFTGAMKDYEWATIVGTTTFGKGIVQNLIPLQDGTAVKITTAHYYTPNGFDLHGKGIEPDKVVELNEELKNKVVVPLEEDNQYQAAVEALN